MSGAEFTPFEVAVLDQLRVEYPELPVVREARIISRENAASGRFTRFGFGDAAKTKSGIFSMNRKVNLDGVEGGIDAILFVDADGWMLELFSYTDWDGVERRWNVEP